MPKRKTPELKPEEQFKRFAEAAKDKGVDTEAVEKAFAKIASPTSRPRDNHKRGSR